MDINYKHTYGALTQVNDQQALYQLTHPISLDELLSIARLIATDKLKPGVMLSSPEACRDALLTLLNDIEREVFACLFLDNQHQLRKFEILFTGTIDRASIYPREVVKRALAYNAAAVIFAHNHPSGTAEPSQADRKITRQCADALALVDVRVLDHFVIGSDSVVSLAERGWL